MGRDFVAGGSSAPVPKNTVAFLPVPGIRQLLAATSPKGPWPCPAEFATLSGA
jgi:hypothetical protein